MASDLVVFVEALCFGIHCIVALARCGGFMEVFDGFWPLGTHTFWVDLLFGALMGWLWVTLFWAFSE